MAPWFPQTCARATRLVRFILVVMAVSHLAMAVDEEGAMLSTIRDRPQDDTIRVVYADWLDEHGDPARAQFIRLQVEAARLKPGSVEHRALTAKADKILQAHEAKWLPKGFREAFKSSPLEVIWERGFPADLVFHVPSLPKRDLNWWSVPRNGLPMLSQISPQFPHLSQHERPGLVEGLLEFPLIGDVPSLNLTNQIVIPSELRRILAAMRSLRRLDLSSDTFSGGTLNTVVNSPTAKKLQSLVLRGMFPHGFSAENLSSLAGGHFPALTELDLSGSPIPDLSPLIQGEPFPVLTRLLMDGDRVPQQEVNALIRSRLFLKLQSFILDCTETQGAEGSTRSAVVDEIVARDHALVELVLGKGSASLATIRKLDQQLAANREKLQCVTLTRLLSER